MFFSCLFVTLSFFTSIVPPYIPISTSFPSWPDIFTAWIQQDFPVPGYPLLFFDFYKSSGLPYRTFYILSYLSFIHYSLLYSNTPGTNLFLTLCIALVLDNIPDFPGLDYRNRTTDIFTMIDSHTIFRTQF